MTNNDYVVEQIVRSLSFEVIAVPTEKVVQSCTSKSTPLNVKIKVKKKDGDLQQGILATSKLGPDGVPQGIKLVSSDHTIMSFNVVMEDADFVKPVSSRKTVIPNLPIHPGTHDGPYNQTTNQIYKADIKESRTSQSDGALKSTFTLNKVEQDKRLNTSPKVHNKKDIIFGKCKPGGCLDPPFGEDKYSYEPTHENLQHQESINISRPRTSSIFSNKLFKKKKIKSDKLSAKLGEQDSVLSQYQGDSLQASATLSNSLITYPSIVNENDIKQKLAARNYESISKKSIDINNGSLYIIPKKNKISTELKDCPSLDQKDNKPEQTFIQTVVTPQENDSYVRHVPQMPIVEPNSHKELISSTIIEADPKAEDQTQNDTVETLLTGYNINVPINTNDFEPHEVSDISNLNKEAYHENHFKTQDIGGLIAAGIISAGVISMTVAENEKSQQSTTKPDGPIAEKKVNDKDSHFNETPTMKMETNASSSGKSIDDNIDNLSFVPRTITEKNEISSVDEYKNNKGIEYKENTAEEPKTRFTEKDNNMDNGSEVNEITSDILLKEYSIPAEKDKIIPLKGQGLGGDFIHDDTDQPDVSKDVKSNKLNSIATIDIDLQHDWKDATETIDFNISIAQNSLDILQDKLSSPIVNKDNGKILPLSGKSLGDLKYEDLENQNQSKTESLLIQPINSNIISDDSENKINRFRTADLSIEKKSSDILQEALSHIVNSNKTMPSKDQKLGEKNIYSDMDILKQTRSKDLEKDKINSVDIEDLDFNRDWKDSNDTVDLNLTINNHNLTPNKEKYYEQNSTTNRSEHIQIQLLNKNSNPENEAYEHLNNDLNVHTPESIKDRIKTDSSSITSIRKDKFNVNDNFLNDKISKQNESILFDTKQKATHLKPTLAQDNDSESKEKLKLRDTKQSDSKMDQFDKYGTKDKDNDANTKKSRDSDNVSKRSKSSVSFDDIVLKNTDIKKLKSTSEINKPIKIDLGFHSYTTDKNEIIIKSFDSKTVLNRHPKDAIIMTSCNVRDPFEMKVPIDDNNLLLIQVKNNSKDDSNKQSSILSKYSDRRSNNIKSAIKTIQEGNKHAEVSKLSEVYEKVYENEFSQFHEMIKKLKQEVDVLIHQQNAFKENLRSKRIKQFKLLQGNKRCSCSKKL